MKDDVISRHKLEPVDCASLPKETVFLVHIYGFAVVI